MQSDVGVDTVKELLSQFKLFRDEVHISFAALSAENSDLKSQLLETSKLLRLFTTAKGNFKGIFVPYADPKMISFPQILMTRVWNWMMQSSGNQTQSWRWSRGGKFSRY